MRTPHVALLTSACLLAACGTETTGRDEPHRSGPTSISGAMPSEIPEVDGDVTTGGPVTVLDDGKGAEACLSGVLDSLPPQCGGPTLVGWDWAEHEGDFEERATTRWGDFVITGVFDGESIRPSAIVAAKDYDAPEPVDDLDWHTPCPEPDGGWAPVDTATTTEKGIQAASRVASGLPDYAEMWVDLSMNPVSDEEPGGIEWEFASSDPRYTIVNVSVTDDLSRAEAAVREVWGGPLCVSRALHTNRELEGIQGELTEIPGMLSSDYGEDRVNVYVTYDDGSLQAWADQAYGDGVVVVSSALVPVDG